MAIDAVTRGDVGRRVKYETPETMFSAEEGVIACLSPCGNPELAWVRLDGAKSSALLRRDFLTYIQAED